MAAKKEVVIEVKPVVPKMVTITIVGDSDLILNKMNAPTERMLTDIRNDKAKNLEKPNRWEEIITSIHWLNGTPEEFTEESFVKALTDGTNAPCITTFGFKKILGQAVTRNGIQQYKTGFDATVNINGKSGLIPIKFSDHFIEERLMSPKKGSPILAKLNHFVGWSADISVSFLENVYSCEQIVNIINLAGFGLGIGSGCSSGFGRFHVEGMQ